MAQTLTTPVVSVATPSLLAQGLPFSAMPTAYNTGELNTQAPMAVKKKMKRCVLLTTMTCRYIQGNTMNQMSFILCPLRVPADQCRHHCSTRSGVTWWLVANQRVHMAAAGCFPANTATTATTAAAATTATTTA